MPKSKPTHHAELPSIDTAALQHVTGGAGMDMSAMLPMMMMMRQRSAAAAAPVAPPPPPTPKILVNGVEQSASALSGGANGSSFTTTV
jgi:hypothetical protein